MGHINKPLSDNELVSFIQELGPMVKLIIFDEFSMLSREIFAAAMDRLKEAGHKCYSTGLLSNVGFVFVGDPAQILPVVGNFYGLLVCLWKRVLLPKPLPKSNSFARKCF